MGVRAGAGSSPDAADLASKESKGDKVVLKNPRWDIETVGFNEETNISVEAVLPEFQTHKTRVVFELFALTPEGAERISQADGHVSEGIAAATSRNSASSSLS